MLVVSRLRVCASIPMQGSLLTTSIRRSRFGTVLGWQTDRGTTADDLVEFVDEIVGTGGEPSRAAVVARALDRERRRVIAARDAEILAATGPDPELAGLAEHAAGVPFDG